MIQKRVSRTGTGKIVCGFLIALVIGCTGKQPGEEIGKAVRLDGWEGIRNLSRDGRFYFGGQPDEPALRRLAEEEGIRLVVNLRTQSEMERLEFSEPDLLKELGIGYLQIPVMPDKFSAADVETFSKTLDDMTDPVLIHCASSNRVGGFWASYLVLKKGFEIEDALSRGSAAGLRAGSMTEAARRVMNER